jgi:hypothetical protein
LLDRRESSSGKARISRPKKEEEAFSSKPRQGKESSQALIVKARDEMPGSCFLLLYHFVNLRD